MIRRILIGIILTVVVVVSGVFIAVKMIPPEVIEEQFEEAATNALGRDVSVDGPLSVSIFPTRLSVTGLRIANAEGFSEPYLLRVEEARIGVKLLALLSRKVEITEFVLDAPNIRLQTASDGRVNWALGSGASQAKPLETPNTEPASAPQVSDIRLGDVRIDNGTVTFASADGSVYRAEKANLKLELANLDAPFTMTGDLVLEGQPTELDLKLTSPRSLMTSAETSVELSATVGENSANTKLTLANGLAFRGNMDIDFPALRKLVGLSGAELPTPNGFERLKINGSVTGSASRFAFGEGTALTFDEITGTGAFAIDLSGNVALVSGTLDLGTLDLSPYIPSHSASEPPPAGAEGFPQWSEAPIDFSAFSAVNADLGLSVGSLIVPPINIGASKLQVELTGGDLTANIPSMALYAGSGSGSFSLSTSGRSPRLSANVALQGVDVGEFANDLANISRLEGVGGVTINVSANGRSQIEWVNSLSGEVGATLGDGGLKGINFGKVVQGTSDIINGLQNGGFNAAGIAETFSTLSATANAPAEKTDFSSLVLATRIQQGTISPETLRIESPAFIITGAGKVELPPQRVDLTLTPAVINDGNSRQLPAPIYVRGTFNSTDYGVDTNGLIKTVARGGLESLIRDNGLNIGAGSRDNDEKTDETIKDQVIERGLNELFGKRRRRD